MINQSLTVAEVRKNDLSFLLELWQKPKVMQYADEFPKLRGWSKSSNIEFAWQRYEEKRAKLGNEYTQLIIWLEHKKPIGESFFTSLDEGYAFGKWHKPNNVVCVIGDIKLDPLYWGRGLGTEGMRQVVRYVFTKTACKIFIVPPHRKNPAASRVYEKAGFVLFTGMRSWRNHKIMELTRGRFNEIYGE